MTLSKLPPRLPTDQPKGSGWSKDGRGSAAERGYGWAWRKLRKLALERDAGLCQVCRRFGRITPNCNEVDHRLPKAKGGTDALENLQTICRPCHERKTLEDEGKRYRAPTGLDGWPKE